MKTQKRAVLYLRSSKDRHDVSIESQREQLQALAETLGMTVVREFADVVESAKTEFRPGFQQITTELKRPGRAWDAILLLDTARLGRRRYIGEVFRHECQRRGVEVIFKSIPEVDPISKVLLESVMAAMDEVHSLMSRDKGLAGMEMNVRRGFRAGGTAPRGYRLRPVDTGVVREGKPVMKSVLEPNEDASKVARFLSLRAEGVPRVQAIKLAGVPWAASTLVHMEWNALTYAGHTVWRQDNERVRHGGAYVGGVRRRPRSEWVIQRDTHQALITEAEAEHLIRALETSRVGEAISRAKSGVSDYLLTGVLVAPDGRPWIGQKGRFYRIKAAAGERGRQISAGEVDAAVIARLRQDFGSDLFRHHLLSEAHKQAATAGDGANDHDAEIRDITKQIDRALELAMQMDEPAALLRKADALERRRAELMAERDAERDDLAARRALKRLTMADVSDVLSDVLNQMGDQAALKRLIESVCQNITLDPDTMRCEIHYKIPMRLSMALPRVRGGWTHVEAWSETTVLAA